MIWIFHREVADASSCETYDDLFQYINLKLLLGVSHLEQTFWSFSFLRLAMYLSFMKIRHSPF